MIKAYALNKNGKIELTLEELQKLIDEAVEEGKRLAGQPCIVYRECPIQTIPVVKRTEIGDPLPWWQQVTFQGVPTETESGRATSDFSVQAFVTAKQAQNITGQKV